MGIHSLNLSELAAEEKGQNSIMLFSQARLIMNMKSSRMLEPNTGFRDVHPERVEKSHHILALPLVRAFLLSLMF